MDGLVEALTRNIEQLLGRASGPMHVRLVLQPVVATILAIRAGLHDARTGQPPFLWTWITVKSERQRLTRSAWKDVGKVFLIACGLDTIYQLFVLRDLFIFQVLLVATVLSLVPYNLVRGLVTRIYDRMHEGRTATTGPTKPL